MTDVGQSETKFENGERQKDGEETFPSFSQIRKQFEEKSRLGNVGVCSSPKSTILPQATETSEFKQLYPTFKKHFTRRQFEALECCFKLADTNQDGFLEAKEIKQLLADHKLAVNLCDADVIISMGDHDEDGRLSPSEFLTLCQPTAEILRQQQHMEGTSLPSDRNFIETVVQKLRTFVTPINSPVKGARKFFEGIISNGKEATGERNKMEPTPKPRKSKAHFMVSPKKM